MTKQEIYRAEEERVIEQYIKHHVLNEDGTTRLSVEFTLSPKCNYKCDYCYIANHGKELHEGVYDTSEEVYLKNIGILLDTAKKNGYAFSNVSLFSGEPFATDFGLHVLEYIYEKNKDYNSIKCIEVPSNFSFISRPNYVRKLKEIIWKFDKELGIPVHLSCSIDGKYCDNITRESKELPSVFNKRDDAYYDALFDFAKEMKMVGFHPMISAHNVFYWKENFAWWVQQLKRIAPPIRYTMNSLSTRTQATPYMLEVRNNDWTEDSLGAYRDLLYFMYKYELEHVFNNDKRSMVVELFRMRESQYTTHFNIQKSPLEAPFMDNRLGCSIQGMLYIRIADLAIIPCHRLSYKKFIYGKCKVTDGIITGIEKYNFPLMVAINSMNPRYFMTSCSNCDIRDICQLPCLGSNYESQGDPFINGESVCKMMHANHLTNYAIYKAEGLYDIARELSAQINHKYDERINCTEKILEEVYNKKNER